MKTYESDDYETAIEEVPGVVGYTWDGEFFPPPFPCYATCNSLFPASWTNWTVMDPRTETF